MLQLKKGASFLILFLGVFFTSTNTNYAQELVQKPDTIIGKWQNEDGSKTIEFTKSGNQYEAKVIASKNSEVIGKKILSSFVYDGTKLYNGKIYLPKRNKTFPGTIEITGTNTMTLTADAGFTSREQRWLRVK